MVGPEDVDPLATFDWTTFESPSAAVVSVLAAETDIDPLELEPLFSVIDPDALDDLFAETSVGAKRTPSGSIVFEFLGYWIVINANGRGYIYERAEDLSPAMLS